MSPFQIGGRLGDRVLHSPRLDIYAGGRDDIAAGRVDVRVLAVLLYLAESYDSVTVSCLIQGHSFFPHVGRVRIEGPFEAPASSDTPSRRRSCDQP